MKLSEDEMKDVISIQKRIAGKIEAHQKEIKLLERNYEMLEKIVTESSFTSAADLLGDGSSGSGSGANTEIGNAGGAEAADSAAAAAQPHEAPNAEPGSAAPGQPSGSGTVITDSGTGKPLADVQRTQDRISITIAEGLPGLAEDVPPFRSFFIDRILGGMQKGDAERVRGGSLQEHESISYEVDADPGTGRLRRILIKNYGDERRASEILSTAGWSFARMLEKEEAAAAAQPGR
ncbi:MAG: hypothetical protein OXK17_01380 [Thaumarchaeota archaeon]|nr:hypothetical protein [Nitrososphaerota archaeon]